MNIHFGLLATNLYTELDTIKNRDRLVARRPKVDKSYTEKDTDKTYQMTEYRLIILFRFLK